MWFWLLLYWQERKSREEKEMRIRLVFVIDCCISFLIIVGYHLPFQHNKLFHLPYMAVAEISLRISLRVRPEEPFLLLKYIITLSLILYSYYQQSLSLVNTLSCKYNYFPHISWFVLLLLQLAFTNQNTTIIVNLFKKTLLLCILRWNRSTGDFKAPKFLANHQKMLNTFPYKIVSSCGGMKKNWSRK